MAFFSKALDVRRRRLVVDLADNMFPNIPDVLMITMGR